jgi:hypothetical protein
MGLSTTQCSFCYCVAYVITSDPPRLRTGVMLILKCFSTILMIYIIIISAERRPLLDIGLPQSSPRLSVLCCSHPAIYIYSIILFDGRCGVVVGILAYYARGRGFDSRTVQTFVCMNMSVCIGSGCFYV